MYSDVCLLYNSIKFHLITVTLDDEYFDNDNERNGRVKDNVTQVIHSSITLTLFEFRESNDLI